MPRRLLPFVCLLAWALLAAPALAREGIGGHDDTRAELSDVHLARTVRTLARATGTAETGLPAAWCGSERSTDDVADAASDPSLAQFKVVYAYPSDRPDRFAQWRDALQANVSILGHFLGAQSGGRRAVRFDMGTSCGPQYLDIQVVALPGTRASYQDDFSALRDAVGAQLGFDPSDPAARRDVVVFADTLSSQAPGNWWGVGSRYVDDSPDSGNAANLGGLYAALWIPDGEPAPGADPNGWWPEGMLHEMTHNLGAVQWTAPHTSHNDTNGSAYGHCWDGYDVMCYRDGPFPAHDMTYDCPQLGAVMNQSYDCGGDDYFNVAPPAGSYLATHWNIYDSDFLGSCETLVPACAGNVTPLALPANTALPQLAGSAAIGGTLTASTGSWTNAPASYAYHWERGDGSGWTAIPAATGPDYPASALDLGTRLRVTVIATNHDGSSAATSLPSAIVTAPSSGATPAATPASAAAPALTGSATAVTTKAVLKRGRRTLAVVRFSTTAGLVRATASKLRLPRGRYALKLCLARAGSGAHCVRRPFAVRSRRAVRPPALVVALPWVSGARASLALSGRGFAARTAKRPVLGVLVGRP